MGKALPFLHLIQCHDSLWFSDLYLPFLNCILSKYSYHREQKTQPEHLSTCYRQAILEVVDQHTRTSIQKPPPVCSASLRIMTAALGSSGSSSSSPLSHLTHGNLVHIQSLELESGALWLTSQVQIVFFSSVPTVPQSDSDPTFSSTFTAEPQVGNQSRQGRLQ